MGAIPKVSRTTVMVLALAVALALFSSAAFFGGVSVNAQTAPIVATSVTGSVDLNNPGHEAFWSQIAGVAVPLSQSTSAGGATKNVTLKFANNGTHILVFATWSDQTESRIGNPVIENPSYPGLFYANSTYYYEDRIAFWWSLDQNPGPAPVMQKACLTPAPGCIGTSGKGHGEGESLVGTGNLWHWKAARTDSLGHSYGKLKYGCQTGPPSPVCGKPLLPPHSYADNEFINTTGHYQLGWDQYPTKSVPGNFTIGNGESGTPYNTFLVAAHGVYDNSTHTWSWVAARALTTTPTLHTVQFTQGKTYYFAVGVWNGGPIPIPSTVSHPSGWSSYGENEETKSVSGWNTLTLGSPTTSSTSSSSSSSSVASSSSSTSASSTTPATSGTDYTTLGAIGVVVAIVVISVAALALRRRGRSPTTP